MDQNQNQNEFENQTQGQNQTQEWGYTQSAYDTPPVDTKPA